MTVINPDDFPCNCRACHACAILGIAYPLPTPTEPAQAEPEPQRKAERKPVPTLFDGVPA